MSEYKQRVHVIHVLLVLVAHSILQHYCFYQ